MLGTFFADYTKSGRIYRDDPTGNPYLNTRNAVNGEVLELLSAIPWNHATGHRYVAGNSWITGPSEWQIHRFLINLDCYNLPLGIVKSAANLFVCVYTHFQMVGEADMCVVEGTFGDPLALADYSQLGDIKGGTAFYQMGYWEQPIPFNAAGLPWITPGTTKLGVRASGDVEAWEPTGIGINVLRTVLSRSDLIGDYKYVSLSLYDAVCGVSTVTISALLRGYNCPYLEVEYSGAPSPTYPRHRFIYKLTTDPLWTHQTPWQYGIPTTGVLTAILSGLVSGSWYDYRTETEKRAGEIRYGSTTKQFRCTLAPVVPIAINKAYALAREEL